jgi:hypothetical protein
MPITRARRFPSDQREPLAHPTKSTAFVDCARDATDMPTHLLVDHAANALGCAPEAGHLAHVLLRLAQLLHVALVARHLVVTKTKTDQLTKHAK